MKKNKSIIIGMFVLMALFILSSCSGKENPLAGIENSDGDVASDGSVTLFKSMSCGCCGIYSSYLDKQGVDVIVKNMPDMDVVKKDYGVPKSMESCHTTAVGDYFVEGHIPIEAITKLLNEKPDIAGIAMPGMPSGSPGMPGTKNGAFVIYAVNHDGSTQVFMRI